MERRINELEGQLMLVAGILREMDGAMSEIDLKGIG